MLLDCVRSILAFKEVEKCLLVLPRGVGGESDPCLLMDIARGAGWCFHWCISYGDRSGHKLLVSRRSSVREACSLIWCTSWCHSKASENKDLEGIGERSRSSKPI